MLASTADLRAMEKAIVTAMAGVLGSLVGGSAINAFGEACRAELKAMRGQV